MASFIDYVFALFIPYVVVNHLGTERQFWLSILLSICGYIPGLLHAWTIVWKCQYEVDRAKAIVLYNMAAYVCKCIVTASIFRNRTELTDYLMRSIEVLHIRANDMDDITIRYIIKSLITIVWFGLFTSSWKNYRKMSVYRNYVFDRMVLIYSCIFFTSIYIERFLRVYDTQMICVGYILEMLFTLFYGVILVHCMRALYTGESSKAEVKIDAQILKSHELV